MADPLAKYGIYIDDLSKIRVLEPEVANQTNKLKEECQNFISSEFRRNRHNCTKYNSYSFHTRIYDSNEEIKDFSVNSPRYFCYRLCI